MSAGLRFAVSVPNFAEFADIDTVVGLAREAEAAGWDAFFTWDHILFDRDAAYPMSDPWIALAAIALATERMRIGTLVSPLARRRPWVVARQAASIDHLSGGRMIFGVGLGYPPAAEFAAFGEEEDDSVRARRLDEALDVITGLWSGEPFSYAGEHYRIEGATFLPRPVQWPRIPIWVAGMWPNRGPLRRAARWDGVAPLKATATGVETLTPEEVSQLIGIVREWREGDAPFDIVHGGPPPWGGGTDFKAALAAYADAGLTWWLESCGWEPGSFADLQTRVRQGPPRLDG